MKYVCSTLVPMSLKKSVIKATKKKEETFKHISGKKNNLCDVTKGIDAAPRSMITLPDRCGFCRLGWQNMLECHL